MITHQLTMLVREFFVKNKTVIMAQPPYLSELAPADLFFFPKLKTTMKRKHFAALEERKKILKQKLLAIPKSAFQKCFKD